MSKNDNDIIPIIGEQTNETLPNENDPSNNIVHTNQIALETINDLENELAMFRNEWKRELSEQDKENAKFTASRHQTTNSTTTSLSITNKKAISNVKTSNQFPVRTPSLMPPNSANNNEEKLDVVVDYNQPKSNEEKAQYLFNKAVLLEEQSRHYEAIKFYRLAMQLDADIELKVAQQRKSNENNKNNNKKKKSTGKDSEGETEDEDEDENKNADRKQTDEDVIKTLYEQFQTIIISENRWCEKNYPQKGAHISDLPVEVIMLILKWVVSDHLDMRSLDNFAAVCKGFYVCARDEELWRQASAKIWGTNNINNFLPIYSGWRNMFLKRPRLNYDGCYISKASYARAGEQSLDNLYRPWHLVEYYRYFRFFSDGTVLFLTTPDEPKLVVTKLKQSSGQQSNIGTSNNYMPSQLNFIMNEHTTLKGSWTLALNKVSIVVCKKIFKANTNRYGRRQANKESILECEHIYRMELELNSSAKRLNNQLNWVNYEINVVNKLANTSNITKFELNKVDFPSFYFSRVKSYSLLSSMPLK